MAWTILKVGLPTQALFRDSIVDFHFANYRNVYALGWHIGPVMRERFAIKTTDAGATWTQISTSMGAWLGIQFPNPSTGYIAGDSGLLFKTVDGGSHWLPCESGIASRLDVHVRHFIILGDDHKFAATPGSHGC